MFQWACAERHPNQIPSYTPAEIDHTLKPATAEEIEVRNAESHDVKKSVEVTEKATKENTEATTDAISLFRNVADSATKTKDNATTETAKEPAPTPQE
jgi:hypothetical protein